MEYNICTEKLPAAVVSSPRLFSLGGAYRLEIIRPPSERVWCNAYTYLSKIAKSDDYELVVKCFTRGVNQVQTSSKIHQLTFC